MEGVRRAKHVQGGGTRGAEPGKVMLQPRSQKSILGR
jgi:hypothetical protein